MSEADWWLCDACQSLNNLSARRCYSCSRRKPKGAERASHHLGYRAVVSWDGKVRLEQAAPPPVGFHVQEIAKRPPPLRDPVLRSIAELAPPPPQGARITYWLGDPARDPRPRPAGDGQPLRPMVGQPGGPITSPRLVARMPGPPIAPTPPITPAPQIAPAPPQPRPMVAVPIEPVVPPTASGPVVAVPIVPSAPTFPHWHDLLDVPTPDPERLRQRLGSAAHRPPRASWSGSTGLMEREEGSPKEPSSASASSRASQPFVAWPAVDLASRRAEPEPG